MTAHTHTHTHTNCDLPHTTTAQSLTPLGGELKKDALALGGVGSMVGVAVGKVLWGGRLAPEPSPTLLAQDESWAAYRVSDGSWRVSDASAVCRSAHRAHWAGRAGANESTGGGGRGRGGEGGGGERENGGCGRGVGGEGAGVGGAASGTSRFDGLVSGISLREARDAIVASGGLARTRGEVEEEWYCLDVFRHERQVRRRALEQSPVFAKLLAPSARQEPRGAGGVSAAGEPGAGGARQVCQVPSIRTHIVVRYKDTYLVVRGNVCW